ncbi:TPA: hypothetical protein ACH3X1_002205 [Trebouxia sp. C0004]
MIAKIRRLVLYTLLWYTTVSAYTSEEHALVQFAGQLSNFREVAAENDWHGWGLDNNTLCPSTQISTTQELMCEPGYPGGIDQASQSWTGVTCTPEGYAVCLSLPGFGLSGNVSLLLELAPLKSMQVLNLANNSLTGTLPSDLPWEFRAGSTYGVFALTVMYLSNNSISGSLPAAWGGVQTGWGVTFQRLYLDNNHISGQLPETWSDSNSLYDLGRLDLFANELTGSLPWIRANMPSLDNLVLLPGNNFCGSIPDEYYGVVRNYTGNNGPYQVLANVTSFDASCTIDMSQLPQLTLNAGILGSMLASVAGAVLAVLLWCCMWRRKSSFGIKSYADLIGSQHSSDQTWFKSRPNHADIFTEPQLSTDTLSTDKLSSTVNDSKASSSVGSPTERYRYHQVAEPKATLNATRSTIAIPGQPIAEMLCSSVSTAFFTSRPITSEVSNLTPITWPSLSPMQQSFLIPAPLWQDVEISPDDISIAQTAAGTDWILGQGSYGMVYKGVKDGVHDVAIKIFRSVTTVRDLELLQTEIAVLRSCNNRNIVHFYGVSFKQADAWLVMELLDKGNLYNALAYGKGLCTWYNRYFYADALICACHSYTIDGKLAVHM